MVLQPAVWIYAGYYYTDPNEQDPALKVPACKRHGTEDKSGLGVYPKWTFVWPLNRRIVYNRCSADPAGRPWKKDMPYIYWDGTKWITNDVPDFSIVDAVTKEPLPPEKQPMLPSLCFLKVRALLCSFRLERWAYAGTL